MQCPFCQNEMGNAQDQCPRCRRKHSPYVAYYLARGWNDLKRNAQTDARSAFDEALRVTPPADQKQLQTYIAYLVQQVAAPGAVVGAALASAHRPEARPQPAQPQPSPQPQPAKPQAAPPRSPTVSAPAATRPQISATRPEPQVALFFNFNEKPGNIVRVMDEARQKQTEFARTRSKRIWIVPLFLLGGLLFIYLDALIGYNYFTFSLVGLVLWGAAVASFVLLMRNRSVMTQAPKGRQGWRGAIVWIFLAVFGAFFCIPFGAMLMAFSPAILATLLAVIAAIVSVIVLLRSQPSGNEFGSRFHDARAIFETIKDDLSPKRTLMGWLDLTGLQPKKVVRQNTSPSGMPVNYYRDEWLKMKMSLYDGNVMRVTVMERVKAQMGRWKRGRSGKQKWKTGKSFTRNELRVAITVNQETYAVAHFQSPAQTGKFLVNVAEATESRLALSAATDHAIDGQDVLQILRLAYDHLQPRKPATTGG